MILDQQPLFEGVAGSTWAGPNHLWEHPYLQPSENRLIGTFGSA